MWFEPEGRHSSKMVAFTTRPRLKTTNTNSQAREGGCQSNALRAQESYSATQAFRRWAKKFRAFSAQFVGSPRAWLNPHAFHNLKALSVASEALQTYS